MAKIIGNTTATPNPRPDWNQTDETKADYIKNKPTVLTEDDVVEIIEENGGGGGGSGVYVGPGDMPDDCNVQIDPDGEAVEVYSKKEIDNMMGDIETALDNIIAIQNTLIGGEGV